jgi:ATP/maltotriose-dependent transcriptional regulator MalT/DNA-binding SARP family transcriptional activator
MEQTPVAKMLPPARPVGSLARPALAARVADVLSRRLTTVIAEAGYGKSTLLASWWEMAPCAWYTADPTDRDMATLARQLADALRLRVPELRSGLARAIRGVSGPDPDRPAHADALGSRLAQVVHAHVDGDLILIIDDVDELGSANPSARLIEAFCRHAPPRLHLVLAGRSRPLFPVGRLRGQGQLLELGGEQLAFTTDEVAQLARERLGAVMPGLPERLHRLAGGWPAAVILAIEALRGTPRETWPAVLDGLDRTRTPLYAYLAEEVFAHQTASTREAVGRLAIFDQFTPELCDAIGIAETRSVVRALAGQSLFVETRQDGSLALRPLIRDYALQHLPLPTPVARELRLTAAEWLAGTGSADAAARMLLAAGAPDRLALLIADEGETLLAAGHTATVLEACRAIPDALRTPAVEQVEGEARQIQGDWKGALACYERAAGGHQGLPAPLARRIGLLHYLRGHVDTALTAYRRGLEDPGAEPAEMASLLAWTATAHWLRGDVDHCRSLAARALAAADACGDRRALAAAHTVMGMLAALDGDRRGNDAHYLLALRAAEEAGDVLQTVRIRTNRASHFLEEGSYPQALQELEVAVRLAELTSFANFHALSLCNRGEARMRMGRLDEALVDLEASRDRYQQIASDMVAYPLCLIGELHRERGNLVQARAAYEEAVSIAEGSGDRQALVPALAGLATVLVRDDPQRATEIARRAVGAGSGLDQVAALLSAGWVAAVAGERTEAARLAAAAASAARARRDRAGLADALALTAMSAARPGRETRHLREAASIWRDVGNPVGEAKVALALAALETGSGASARRRVAEHRLEALGVHPHGGGVAAGLLALVGRTESDTLRIESLGRFAVIRGGERVRLSEWQSKRARELLKLLVARRGRPASRGYLMETLWPDEDPEKVANRLSVALSTIRSVLDPRRSTPEGHLHADKDAVALDLEAIDVDLEGFLGAAAEGLASVRRGDLVTAVPALEAAAALYCGDFLEENPYDDWTITTREEARAAYVAVCRALAANAATASDPEAAIPHLLRILETDRYDEQAHLGLVSALLGAGRHGEAHRHYLNYRRAMDDLGVEPAPFPGPQARSAGGPGASAADPAFRNP